MLARDETETDWQADDCCTLVNASGSSPLVLVCEHASNHIPDEFGDLGLSADARQSHIAWDPGALGVATELSSVLDAPLLVQNVSRLVYDCNRPPDEASAIPEKSEIYSIPGNANLPQSERDRRTRLYYDPFRLRLSAVVEEALARFGAPVLATIHSFTPIYFGQPRTVELGILHDEDARLADFLLASMTSRESMRIERNQPYGAADGVTHTLRFHALPKGIPNVMIEIRNDLIATEMDQKKMAATLARYFASAIGQFASNEEGMAH
ncbi:MAG: N-formylglutamate amidohydrolase [Hyphomicrobiaceae bacterium]|nr:N-formylglutamate amidohydrolase [Hyphomicrobiaceae bacterium]